MTPCDFIAIGLFWIGFGCPFFVFVLYPGFLFLGCHATPGKNNHNNGFNLPSISVLVVFRNSQDLLEEKIKNFSALDYPKEKLELIMVSDGSTDRSIEIIEMAKSLPIKLYNLYNHQGKISGLNFGVEKCSNDIILFSDADAILEIYALRKIVRHFCNPLIGGVCGKRLINEGLSKTQAGQEKFIQWDTMIKSLEMKSGISITSNDGKIYAIRKRLFLPVRPGVTDDAYIALSIIQQKYRFVFEPKAIAFIKKPSRYTMHELVRRKRIVSTSLTGLKHHIGLFNPFKYGFFSFGLFINKVLRRMIPFALILILLTSLILSLNNYIAATLFFRLQITGYMFFLLYPAIISRLPDNPFWVQIIKKLGSIGYFFCVGMAGTFIGVLTFLSGRKISKWEPIKK